MINACKLSCDDVLTKPTWLKNIFNSIISSSCLALSYISPISMVHSFTVSKILRTNTDTNIFYLIIGDVKCSVNRISTISIATNVNS